MKVKFLIDTLHKLSFFRRVIQFNLIFLFLITHAFEINAQCSGNIYDSGGSGGNYSNNENITTVLDATAGKQMQISFNSFNVESGYDYLYIYDGPTTSSPLLATYSGTSIPADITSSGQFLTIRFTSDNTVTRPGYSIALSCIDPPPVPDCLVVAQEGNGTLYSWISSPAGNTPIGTLNATEIETMCLSFDGQTIYAADAGIFGTISNVTGAFTVIATIGNADGALGNIDLDDVDGMAIIPSNGYIMATHRRSSDNDLLFVINPITGTVEKNYFGSGVDYREIVGALQDMDDIAFHPTTNELYGVSTVSNSTTFDRIVLIDQYLGTVSTISNLPTCDIEGLTFNNAGVLYGSSGFEECAPYTDNTIYEIDYSNINGSVTAITTLPQEDTESIVCFVSAIEPCNEVVTAGIIGSYQAICAGDDVAAFTNVESATQSAGGTIDYKWYYSTSSCISPLNNDPDWIEISGATSATYDHGTLFEKTCFVREAKTQGCVIAFKYSNVITIDVNQCACPSPTTLTYSISSSNDDAEEGEDGTINLTSTDIELIYDAGNQTVGLRFNGVNVPGDANIQSAKIVFKADESDTAPTTIIIQGELTGNSLAFNSTDGNITSRNRTATSTVWSDVEEWTSPNIYSSVFITDIIDEIIQQGTWNPGNSMSFIISGSGKRVAEAFDKSSSTPAQLIIEYCDQEICDNGIDDDGDGDIDCEDNDCNEESLCTPSGSGQICFTGSNGISATANYYIIAGDTTNEDRVKIRVTYSKNFVDNTYGSNAIGWPGNTNFANLEESDRMQIALYDSNNVKKVELSMDYVSVDNSAPSGYSSGGVSTGEGYMILGNSSDIFNTITSIDVNFNDFGYVLTTNSPSTDAFYIPDPAYPNWIYEAWYEFEVNLSAFGASGFGSVEIPEIHASPSKTGNNTEAVSEGPCCQLNYEITGDNSICESDSTILIPTLIESIQTAIIPISEDAYLSQSNPTKNYSSCKEIIISSVVGDVDRGMLKIDFSSIPAGVTLNNATLVLTKNGGDNIPMDIGVHEITTDWFLSSNASCGGGTSKAPNWNESSNGSNWTTNGGDYLSVPTSTTTISGNAEYNWDVSSIVQSWCDGSSNNYGLLLKAVNENTGSIKEFASIDDNNESISAKLLLEYKTIPNPEDITYNWSNGQTSDSITVNPATTTSYYVTISEVGGCIRGDSLTVTVFDVEDPVITGSDSICIGDSTTLTPNTGGTWVSSNNAIATITNAGIVTGISSGSAIFTFTNNTTLCVSPASAFVSVEAKTIVSITGPTSICEGFTSQLSPTTGGVWSSNDPGIATVTNGGVVTGISPGSTTFVFTNSTTLCASDATLPIIIIGIPTVSITGSDSICEGETTTLSPISGGTWNSSNTAIATITNGGIVTGISPGIVTFTFTDATTLCSSSASNAITIKAKSLVSVTGPSSICEGFTSQLSPTTGGLWASNNTGVATVANDGTVTGVSVGSTTFVFTSTSTGCASDATQPITVNEIPTVSITGSDSICEGETTNLSPSTGGTWVSSNTAIATVSNSGVVIGVSAGTATFTFTNSTTLCESLPTTDITIIAKTTVAVTGPISICEGFTSQLSPTTGGTWNSNDVGVATVTNDGTVTGVSVGSTTFVFTNTASGCASDATQPITVSEIPTVSITGTSNICIGFTTTVSPTSGGTWSSSNTAVATITNGGIITGISDGTATFTFTSTQGCISSTTETITVDPNGNITISGDPVLCEGETTTLTTSVGGGSWASDNLAIATINSSGLVTAISAGLVTLTYNHNSGACLINPTFGITINELPTVTISGSNTVCVGEITQLTTNDSGGFWTGSDSNIAIVSSEGIVAGISAGTVTFTYTNSNGCESSASGTITVDPAVVAVIDFNGSLCLEEDSQLSAIATDGTPGYSYTWTGPNGFTGNTQTVDISDDGNYDVTITDSKGCSSNTSALVYEQYDPFIFALNSEVCDGEDITLTVSGANGGTFQWDSNANNATTASVTVTPALPLTSYTVTITNGIGCTTSSTAIIDVLDRPTVALTGLNDICVGATTQLSPSSGGTWTSSNYSVANVNNLGVVTGIGGGSAIFTFKDEVTECYSDPTDNVTINDNTTPTISGEDHICMGENPTLTASVTGGTWSSNNAAIATIHSSTGEVTPVSQGSVVITYIPPSSACYNNPTYTINTYADPTLSINGPSFICEGSITYVNSSVSGTWTSSDTSVATVSIIGEVIGIGAGTATFSFVSTVGCTADLATPITIIATPITALTGPSEICINETSTISPTSGGSWFSSNANVATVNNSGVVTGISNGIASFIFIESNYGCVSVNNISVSVKTTPNITAPSTNSLCIGETANITPATGGIWTSSDPSIADISNNGTITALTDGIVTFTFTSDLTGCTSLESTPVIVQPTPTTNFLGPTSICQNETTSILTGVAGYWSTSDVSIATITNQGTITGVSPGTVTFIFTNGNSGCVSDTSGILTVEQPTTVDVTGPGNICVGDTSLLTSNTGGTWTSSNTGIATVTTDGVITGVSPGTVTFIFEIATGCSSEPIEEVVTVASPSVNYIGPSSICIGEITSLSPSSGGTWESSNPEIATISNSGIVTAVAAGISSLTFTDTTTGCSASTNADLIVNPPPSINITGDAEICIGENTNLQPTFGGTWMSSDNSVASITSNGTVTGLTAGTVTFTFVELSTGCSSEDSVPITVLPKPDVSIIGANTICAGTTTTLSPGTGGTWSSNNEAVATVTNNGIVTGVSQGVAKFTFTNFEGCESNQTAPVIVFDSPTTAIDGTGSICINETVQMLPSSGGTWSSADPGIASIDNSGLVSALMAGSTTFTFTDSSLGCVSDPSDLLTVEESPAIGLTGPSEICIGSSTNMIPATGGNWTSLNPLTASIQNNGEIVGITPGEAKFIFMNLATGCVSDTSSGITVLASPIISFVGPTEICLGDTTYISPSSGGTWESNNPSVATISNAGMIVGVGQGIANFKFTNDVNGCISENSSPLIVNSFGPEYAEDDNICIGATTTLYPNAGGLWMSLNPEIANVTTSGLVTGVSSGFAYFVFTDSITGCSSDGTLDVEVESGTPIVIVGDSEVCIGYTTILSPSIGGVWTSNNEDIATVTNAGVVTGRAPGKVTFTFTESSSGCIIVSTSDSIAIESCKNHDFNVSIINEEIFGNLSTNDNFPIAATYSSSPQLISKPNASIVTFNINPDGSYSFEGNKAGNYRYNIPICLDPYYSGCPTTMVEITLVENQYSTGNPVTNLDIATVFGIEDANKSSSIGGAFEINSIQNDVCIYTLGCDMDWSSAWIDDNASNGFAEIVPNGVIEYTPDAGFIGFDTIHYGMCANGYSKCNTTMQVITVNHTTAVNSIVASDDFTFTLRGSYISGNVLINDSDAEGDSISVDPQGSLMNPVVVASGEYYIDALGNFNFTPNDAFSGHTEIIYQICDNNANQACMQATLHLLVFDDISVKLRVYLQGALMQNGGATSATGLPLMRDDLRVSPFTGLNYLPLIDPYTFAVDPWAGTHNKFNKIGPGLLLENQEIEDSIGVFGVSGDNAIVDWVHVELRSKEDMSIPIATRSGLLQRDGDVVDLDGVSDLRFNAVNVDSFYVVVKHRSHLGAMSQKIAYSETVDFTSPSCPVFNFGIQGFNDFTGLSQNNNVKSGYSALWAGDFDSNGKIKFTNPGDDQNVLFLDVLFTSPDFLINYDQAFGYMTGDFNMNSKTKFTNPSDDINLLFSQILLYPLNSSFLSNYNSLIEQVPDEE